MKIALPLLAALLCTTTCAAPDPYILAPMESAVETIGGLEISVVTQKDWYLPRRGMKRSSLLQIRLRNTTGKAILFPTFDTFHPRLKNAEGDEISFSGGRDATRITPRILLEPGASFAYELVARLEDLAGKGMHLIYQDHTGTWLSAKISGGNYALSLDFIPPHNPQLQTGPARAALWAAKGRTKDVKFTVRATP